MSDINLRTFLRFSKYVPFFCALVYIYIPFRHCRRYSYVKIDEILQEFGKINVANNLNNGTNLKKCPYEELIPASNREVAIFKISQAQRFEKPKLGGEYVQKDCVPYERTAVIVPYRDRKPHLSIFLNYMHYFLQSQYISYRIFIIEQNNMLKFNRAKLLNIGALEAIKQNYPCLILSDVDLLPLNIANIYTCSRLPRHMSSSIDTFRFNLPYETLFGGVISIQSDQFKKVNGMSNEYNGWGGEDDDFYRRLIHHNIKPYRFPPTISKYTMLTHNKEIPSESRFEKLEHSAERQSVDGLASLSTDYIVKLEKLYTHVFVN